jgi:hypothetical protein
MILSIPNYCLELVLTNKLREIIIVYLAEEICGNKAP